MHQVGISLELVTRTVNERHHGLANDGLNRILAVHWLNSDSAIFVDSIVSKHTDDLEQNRREIWQAAPQLAIRLSNVLPAGSINRETPVLELLPIVAESFGLKVSGHPAENPAWVYEGPWDGSFRTFGNNSGSPVYFAFSQKLDLKSCELAWAFDSGKYLPWFVENLAASVRSSMPFRSPLEFINAQKTLLETLFPSGWFVDAKKEKVLKHPAYIRWQRLLDLIARNGRIELPHDIETLDALLAATCDNLSLIQATRGSIDAQTLGDLANYGDEAVQKRLRAVILHPGQFLDVLVEVACAGYHVSRGHKVKATEEEGMPDLELEIHGWPLPIQAECKCVKGNSGVEGAIKKANKQIKNADQVCYGLVYLDISQVDQDPTFWNDSLPQEFATVQSEVERCLRDFNKSVSGVILLWKDHINLRTNDGGAQCYHRYRSFLIRHRNPKKILPEDTKPLMVGNSILWPVIGGGSQAGG
jgi:hypothetical protein